MFLLFPVKPLVFYPSYLNKNGSHCKICRHNLFEMHSEFNDLQLHAARDFQYQLVAGNCLQFFQVRLRQLDRKHGTSCFRMDILR